MIAKDLFDRQLAAIADGDLEALLAQYHDDATVIRFDRLAGGPDEIRDLFAAYLSAKPQVDEITSLQVTDDVIFYNALMTIGGNRVTTYGTLVIRDGRIWRQTAAALPVT
ncbi:nuclear transport factor 2 family protein [Nonomuraea basaltis]|uniref:nuclear transport factor 2 family protein n=1 Tax=Nonomuraea basaltis TaxID=2495887 RepID=UPI00110C6345|nr:nuclear transport factor 2 family protein [Nonomuraea basaltis]TMR89955.1 nuclear transport factor 2 family protein [Nonomuraea basaltis]